MISFGHVGTISKRYLRIRSASFGQNLIHILRSPCGFIFIFSKHTTGREMQSTVFGKPYRITYDYANELLRQLLINTASPSSATAEAARHVGPSVWMVGDNTESDIKGAVDYGWSSALVRTGVYKDHNGPPNYSPTILVDDVEHAVIQAIQREWKI